MFRVQDQTDAVAAEAKALRDLLGQLAAGMSTLNGISDFDKEALMGEGLDRFVSYVNQTAKYVLVAPIY